MNLLFSRFYMDILCKLNKEILFWAKSRGLNFLRPFWEPPVRIKGVTWHSSLELWSYFVQMFLSGWIRKAPIKFVIMLVPGLRLSCLKSELPGRWKCAPQVDGRAEWRASVWLVSTPCQLAGPLIFGNSFNWRMWKSWEDWPQFQVQWRELGAITKMDF